MPHGGLWKARYSASQEGWSAVEKVAQFSQAVGRVSGGRGSAILISLVDNRGQLIDTSSLERSGTTGTKGTNLNHGSTHSHRSGDSSTQRAPHLGNAGYGAGHHVTGSTRDSPSTRMQLGAAHSSTQPKIPPALGVLLTTSHVFRSPQDTASASVCFLDQPMIGTTALIGREPKPVRVGLCSALGFVSSVAAPKKEREGDIDDSGAAARACCSRLDDEPDYLLYAAAAADLSEEDEAEKIGFTLTYCEAFPTCGDTANPTELPPPLNPSQSSGSRWNRADSLAPSHLGSEPHHGGGAEMGKEAARMRERPFECARTQQRGEGGAIPDASHAAGGRRLNQAGNDVASRNANGTQDSLFQVQPLPIPLLLSRIPEIKVGDVHVMITHVNDGRRAYRVQQVADVFADYCTYESTRFGGVTCSGGPVFNVQGDFIGVQHERDGQSLCLRMRSIVRNLFDSDLLGMCHSPISEETVKKRALLARPDDTASSVMTIPRPPGVFRRKSGQTLPKHSHSASLHCAGVATAGDIADGGDRGSLSSRLPALSPGSQRLALSRTEGCLAADTPCTASAHPLATTSRLDSRRTLRHMSSDHSDGAPCKSTRPAKELSTPANAAAAAVLPLSPPSKPLAHGAPGFEEVFAEFFDGAESLPHILYAFSHSLPLVKITLESLAQLKYRDELEHMAAIGGVGAILEAIDMYPQEEQVVASALAALCRICLYEHNLAMFLHLDGVATVMEIMKEYVHQQTVLQWGVYALLCATDVSCPSAAASAVAMVHSSAPQLLVNVLRVHGTVKREAAARRSQNNCLVRWTCDLIANLLMATSRTTTLFLVDDFLTLLLQLSRDNGGDAFLMEGFAHVFCAFVQCFSATEAPPPPNMLQVTSTPLFKRYPGTRSPETPPALPFRERRGDGKAGTPSNAASSEDGGHARRGGGGHLTRLSPPSPNTISADPHEVSFFFLCDAVRRDTDGCLVRAVMDVCKAALDPKSSLTAHRGRPEVVLMRCLETLRVLLTWGLLPLPRGAAMSPAIEGRDLVDPRSPLVTPRTHFSAPSLPSPLPSFCENTADLLAICKRVRHELNSSSELVAKAEAVERLLLCYS
ncbi:hypothetical protein LSCM1_04077 [Leishmania martiniquensis]|uniref:Uncharacterized protein n=1 Tax=Leishmania martiniquensis TaxID=1580590 RepID=A0A836KMV4_9TRYP|nr:hypothetical protein LSCM1_04077 [Leishmania martiniquensis]